MILHIGEIEMFLALHELERVVFLVEGHSLYEQEILAQADIELTFVLNKDQVGVHIVEEFADVGDPGWIPGRSSYPHDSGWSTQRSTGRYYTGM